MVEITKKYKIGKRRFGLVNWVGAWTLYQKEVLRFLIVWAQTIFSPLDSSLPVSYTHLTLPTNREV